jgi:membrane protease YdiL (CAAX protease family)
MTSGPPTGSTRDPEPVPERRWRGTYVVGGYVVGLLAGSLAESIWVGAHHGNTNSLGAVVSGTVGLWVGLLGAALLASRHQGTANLGADFGLRFRWSDPGVGAVAGVLCQYGLAFLVYLPVRSNSGIMHQVEAPAQHITGLAHGPGVVVLVLVLVVGAPVVEELFFRGLLMSALRARIGSAGAVLVSAVLFGLAHFEPLQFPVLALFGVLLGVLTLRTGRLGPNICAHAAFNAVAVYALLSSR